MFELSLLYMPREGSTDNGLYGMPSGTREAGDPDLPMNGLI